ncbi:hypothetical protein [Desulfovibrio piger]|uniref:hypothetical protein n=1 Tax=Desulfovibrio piger TaxID=901 RepID=UPI0026E9D06E|nr:hypothetical protein [Desulfovibrio piger]
MSDERKPMTQEELEKIRKRSDAATPGPWVSEDGGYDVCLGYKPSHIRIGWWSGDHEEDCNADNRRVCELSDGEHNNYKNKEEMQANAEFIAHAREDVPALLDEIERLKKVSRYLAERIAFLDEWKLGISLCKVKECAIQSWLDEANREVSNAK